MPPSRILNKQLKRHDCLKTPFAKNVRCTSFGTYTERTAYFIQAEKVKKDTLNSEFDICHESFCLSRFLGFGRKNVSKVLFKRLLGINRSGFELVIR